MKETGDDSFKHIQVTCSGGVALITYSGLGALGTPSNKVYISDWTRRQLRGQSLTVDQSLIQLRLLKLQDRDHGRWEDYEVEFRGTEKARHVHRRKLEKPEPGEPLDRL